MNDTLRDGLLLGSLVVAALALAHVVADRRPTRWLVGLIGALELALLLQAVVGIVELAGGGREVNGLAFVGYLLGALLVLPAGTVWAFGEPTRSGTAVLVVALLVVAVLELRLEQIWRPGG